MNITDIGYSLVVDLNTSSSNLFLLVKASPILRHSLEDEHNYANYYQFKKQGGHHGVVVTSDHLSPGRWYIGVCNHVQEVLSIDDRKRSGKHGGQGGRGATEYAEYSFIPTLEVSTTPSGDEDCGAECQEKETEAKLMLEKTAPELSKKNNCLQDGTCSAGYTGFSVETVETPSYAANKKEKYAAPTVRESGATNTNTMENANANANEAPQQAAAAATATPAEHAGVAAASWAPSSGAPPIGECGGALPINVEKTSSNNNNSSGSSMLLARLGDGVVVLLVAVVAGCVLLLARGNKSGFGLGSSSEDGGGVGPGGNASKAHDDMVQAEKIAAQLDEARKACEKLQQQLEEERRAAGARQAVKSSSDEAIESATRALSERLVEERLRAGELMDEAGRWRQAAEDAHQTLTKLQREKAAAEHAARVLEEEMQLARQQMRGLQQMEMASKAAASGAHAHVVGHPPSPSPPLSGMTTTIGKLEAGRQTSSASRLLERKSSLLPPPLSQSSSESDFFSMSQHQFSFGGSSPAPPPAGGFPCPSPASSVGMSSTGPSPYSTPGSAPGPAKHFDNGPSFGSASRQRRGDRMFARAGDTPMNSDAFAAFMGVDVAQNSDLMGELEPMGRMHSSPAGGAEGCSGLSSHTPTKKEGGGETRARGRRGGQRRKRATGDNTTNSENAATDCLATSMALAALSDGDA